MADEEYDYDGDYFEDGDNFFYVEETYALADDLTENVIPEPGGLYDHTDDWDDMSRFEYWNDIEYDSDGYNDQAGLPAAKSSKMNQEPSLHGRKRKASIEPEVFLKRPKLLRNQSTFLRDLPPIIFMTSLPERIEPIVDVTTMKSYAILPDWREKFKNIKSVVNISDLAKVPRVKDSGSAIVDEQEGYEEDDDGEEEEQNNEETDPSAAMNALSISLERHLAGAGVDTSRIDKVKMLALAHKMMAQDEDAEDLLADFIEDMYAEDDDEEGNPLAQLLATSTVASKDSQSKADAQVSEPARCTSMEVQESVFDSPLKVDNTPIPRTAAAPANPGAGKKRKPESPETSPQKRRDMKRIPT